MAGAVSRATLHATAVAVEGKGLLIMGASGAGKSTLALALIGMGARLVSDDQTVLDCRDGGIILECPEPAMRGVIEVRGMGLIHAPIADASLLALVVDLNGVETQRLPPTRMIDLMGCVFPLVLKADHAQFPVALMLQLRHGRHV